MKKEKLKILYEDKYLIVIEKRSGMLTIANAHEKENTLYHEVSNYVKKQNKNNKIFIVHRLDKETSGLVIFAKSEKVKKVLQDNWENVIRKYVAVVNGNLKRKKDTLISYLKMTKTYFVYSHKTGKKAITSYEVIKSNKLYSLLDIEIKTGRKNQIRVQLNDINHPIVGDKVYSKIKNKNVKRLCLHANYLKFKHPITNELIEIKDSIPNDFLKLVN